MRLPPQSADIARTRSAGIAPAALHPSRRLTLLDPYGRGDGGSEGVDNLCWLKCFDWCYLRLGQPEEYCDLKCRDICSN